MYSTGSDYLFYAPEGSDKTWAQYADEALQESADADIEIVSAFIDEADRKVSVEASVKYAVSRTGTSVNVFGVIMEDGLPGVQTNGLSTIEAPGLGEWGKGGMYAQQSVFMYYDDVVRGTSAIESNGNYSGFNGRGGYIPSDIKAGEEIPFTFEFSLPSSIVDVNKTKVCLMLIDANTGEYIKM